MRRAKSIFLTKISIMLSAIAGILLCGSSISTKVSALDATAICQGIANDENNNIPETVAQLNPVPRYRTLLKYDVELGDKSNEVNVVSTTGQGIKLNGVPLSDIPNALVDYANGSKYIRIKIPQSYQDALVGGAILEVVAGTPFENKILDSAKFVLNNGKWKKPNEVSYQGITWNATGYDFYAGKNGLLLKFSANLSKTQSEIDGGIRDVNYASSTGEHIYLGGKKLSTLPGAMVSYHSQGLLFIYADDMISYRTFEIKEGTVFLDSLLPQVNLNYNNTTKWTTEAKTYTDVSFVKILWNDTGYDYYAGKRGVLLQYNAHLSKVQNEFDAGIQYINYASTTGENILLGGKKLSTLPGAMVSYHSQGLLFIYADNMSSYRTLEIEAGAKILDASLSEVTLYYGSSTKWSTTKEPAPLVTFESIFCNNAGYDVYADKKGLILSYSENLSSAINEINGDIKTTNYVDTTIGSKIKLNGTKLNEIDGSEIMYFGSTFLWIYAPNMSSYGDLTIESTDFLTVSLPSSHFMFFETEWAEVFKVTNIINGVEKIDYCKKNSKTTIGEGYYSSLLVDEELTFRLIDFKVGDTTYNMNQTLEVNDDVTIYATVIGFETTKGASVRMSEPSGIRFENKIDKTSYDYLVNKYQENNIEVGTYIVSKDKLSLTSFDNYFSNTNNVSGTDYIKIINSSFINGLTAGTDGYYRYVATYDGIGIDNVTTEYCGIGYIKIKDGNNTYTLYGSNKLEVFSRSIYDVIKKAYEDYSVESYQTELLNSYLDGILALKSTNRGMQIDNIAEGYHSPYSLHYDAENGEYVCYGTSKIKTILINGEKRAENGNIVNINGTPYKFTNQELQTSNTSSMFRFKLTPVANASTLVDFTVQIPSDREMRILQLTDTQIIDSSQMRRADRLGAGAVEIYSRSNIDKNCFNHISELIEKENPDLIIITGDIIYGEFDDSGEIWTRIIDFMDSFNIPWAPIFGNHDNESKMGVEWQCAKLEQAKNCLFKKGNLTGNGNYSIGLVDSNGKIVRTLYMLDSNGCLKGAGIAADQINWMKSVSSSIDATYQEKVPGFACYHIPSLDFINAFEQKYQYSNDSNFNLDEDGDSGDFGQKNESLSYFPTALAPEFKKANIDGVFAGHDHVNNYSIEYDGIRYTYGTKTGTYDYHNTNLLGGTLIKLVSDGRFNVSHTYLNNNKVIKRQSASTTITVMSDLHFDTRDYGDFYCTKSEQKLNRIINETQESRFYINLGDTVNSCDGSLNTYYWAMKSMKNNKLNVYNSDNKGYVAGNRMMYNLLGNHEVAYAEKSNFKDFTPYVEGIGSAAVFKYSDLMFVAVDALFDRVTGSEKPSDIISCHNFTIPDKEINYLKNEVRSKMDETIKGIVWISHIALQDIDGASQNKLLNELKSYDLPMTVFEGHTHIEAYRELVNDKTGDVYCKVYTLPAVTLNNKYPYYNVTFKDGAVWCLDKRNKGEL